MPTDLFKLTFAVQLAIVSGYLAYVIAYAGIRQHHTAADTILKTFVFGLVATCVMQFGPDIRFWTPAVAISLTIGCAVLWRWLGMRFWAWLMRHSLTSWADDIPTAWISITATRTDVTVSQIAVEVADGRILLCEDTRMFKDAHVEPFILGLSGDVGLYVTAERKPDGSWEEKTDVRHAGEGDLLTYVPASEIKRVEMRYLSAKGAAAAQAADLAKAAVALTDGLSQGYKSDVGPST